MAELLIRVADKVSTDFYNNARITKRGDVIVVSPNGWPWGAEERTAPFWRILALPNVSVNFAQTFLAREVATNQLDLGRTLQHRAFKLDIDNAALTGQWRIWINDDTRATPIFTSAFSEAQVLGLKLTKPRIVDPVLGF